MTLERFLKEERSSEGKRDKKTTRGVSTGLMVAVSIEGGRYTQQSNHGGTTPCRLEDGCQLQGQVVSSRIFNCLTLKVKARPFFETWGKYLANDTESRGRNVEFVLIKLKKVGVMLFIASRK